MARKSRKRMKRRKSRKSRRRRRGGTNDPVKALVDLFYKPPPKIAPAKLGGLGASNWESEWITLAKEIQCYMGNMAAHKGMARDAYIKKGKGFMMNPKKRQESWDKCKNNAKSPKDWQPIALKYFNTHGFTGPKYVTPPPNFMKIGMSKLPTKDTLMKKLADVKYWHDVEQKRHREEAIAKTKFGGKTRRRKRKKKSRKSKKKRKHSKGWDLTKDLGVSLARDYVDSWGD